MVLLSKKFGALLAGYKIGGVVYPGGPLAARVFTQEAALRSAVNDYPF